ncbi:MAG: glycoside hydrolase family 127 protein [Caldilineaceae bacterium]|nr:glycoside hydrolase family 127 protein [Caldilineaceae bacterium]
MPRRGASARPHEGIFFNDSDVFKIIEGAAYTLQEQPDAQLDAYLDDLIATITAAQESDGYLYTARTIAERNGTVGQLDPEREGQTRWSNLRVNHELYNVGHLYEAAAAHFEATGKRSLLDVALKNADLIDAEFGPGKRLDVPGHQEIEIGLVRLFRVTGEARYLELAKFFLDERGHAHGRPLYTNHDNPGYMQDHLPVVDQREAVGHAVRALYMYAGMADVAALTGDVRYVAAIDQIWENVVGKKLYLTGGLGARHHGEAFGENYELPNDTAYAETCAAIANILWNHRMFLLHGDAKYIDVLERSLYNGFLSGISLSGDHFFYVNPLAFDGHFLFNRDDSQQRKAWFNCSCCPSNVVRLLPSLSGTLYAQCDDAVFVNLFVAGSAELSIEGAALRLTQETAYPWQGKVKIKLDISTAIDFTLHVRIPGWSRGEPVPRNLYRYLEQETQPPALYVNDEALPLDIAQGYARIQRQWQPGDEVKLELPMPIRRVVAHPQVEADAGRVALERGPLVYCFEAVDNGASVLDLALPDDSHFTPVDSPELLGGVVTLHGEVEGQKWVAAPYHVWAHRGVGEMTVWPLRKE